MKKLLLILTLLLFGVNANAATYTLDFSAPYPDPYPFSGQKLYTQPIGPLTVTFGGVWRRGWDCDQPGLGNTCHPCTGQGHYIPTPPGGPPGRQREDDSGDFANEPSPGAVAWMPPGWDGGGGGNDSVNVTFSQVVNSASFWYSSSLVYNFWCYAADSCGYGQFCTFNPGPLGPNPGARTVAFFTAAGTLACDHVVLDQPGTRDETGCVGDPLGSACRWTFVQSPPLYNPANPIKGFRFQISAMGPFFMDDLTVGDPAPGPSLAHSDVDGAIILTGTANGLPAIGYTAIIRDSLDNPIQGATVSLNLLPIGANVRICTVSPEYNCETMQATKTTDANGVASFAMNGMVTAPINPPAIISVNGVSWVTRPVCAMDLNSSGTVEGGDYSLMQSDFFDHPNYTRSDYNGNGVLDGNDSSIWLGHFFDDGTGGCQLPNGLCVHSKPQPIPSSAGLAPHNLFKRDGYYDLAGRRLSRPPASGLYWQVTNGLPRKLVRVR